jgi:hypothetical protein
MILFTRPENEYLCKDGYRTLYDLDELSVSTGG